MSETHSKRIDTLQVVRGLAFVGVFLVHVGYKCLSRMGLGRFGVSLFFVLSGFTMVYSYYGKNRITSVSLKDNLRFAAGKIRSLYPLHALMTLAMSIFLLTGDHTMGLVEGGSHLS